MGAGGGALPNKGSKSKSGQVRSAAEEGDRKKVTLLVNGGADVEDANGLGETALLFAAYHGHYPVAEFLLKRGARPNAANKDRNTPLHSAARFGHTDICDLLLKSKADINSRNNAGYTPLKWAIREGKTATAEFLRGKGGVEKVGALRPAVFPHFRPALNCVRAGRRRWRQGQAGRGGQDQSGARPLRAPPRRSLQRWVAAARESPASTVCAQGADGGGKAKQAGAAKTKAVRPARVPPRPLSGGRPRLGRAPPSTVCAQAAGGGGKAKPAGGPVQKPGELCKAAEKGSLEEMTRLADQGADLQDRREDGRTALHCAALNGHHAVAEFLLQRGARPNAVAKSGATPLHGAALNGRTDICRLLLKYNADINKRANEGRTPLWYAIQMDETPTADALRAEGATK